MKDVQIMKQEKGVTLVILAITIIVLGILGITAIYNGTAGLDTAKKQAFISEMQMIQAKVNTIYERRQVSSVDKRYYDSIGRDISYLDQTKLQRALGGTSSDGFKYYMPEDLEKLELTNMTRSVLINFDTRQVICYEGVEIDGTTYYKLEELSDYIARNIEQDISENTSEPYFTLEKTKLETGKWRISLKNVRYSTDNVGFASVSYKLSSSTNWIITNNLDIEITKPGLYDIKLTDTAGKEKISKEYFYADNGLMLYLDGQNNTSYGHSTNATTWKDLSGNGNDVTIHGAIWKEDCLYFDGTDDYAVIAEMNYSNLTMEAVAMYTQIVDGESVIIGNVEAGGYLLAKANAENNMSFYVNIDGAYYRAKSNKDMQINKKAYFAGKYDGTTVAFFENTSKYTGSKTGTITTTKNNTKMMLGTNPSGNSQAGSFFQGNIYCVRVYNRALTDDEINANYEIDKYRFNIE